MTTATTPNGHTTAIVPSHDRAPAVYGDRAEVKALATRIMAIHPAAKSIGDRGALLLAQLGLALGLNPLPGTGHIHAWVDDDGRMCVHIGLEGRAALARRQSQYSVSTRPMNAAEVEEHGLKPGDRGAIAELYRHDVTREQVALKIPVCPFVGIGIAKSTERVPRGRSLAWRAAQRATKDALRAAFSFELPSELAGAVRVVDDEPEVIDAEPVETSAPAGHVSEESPAVENVPAATNSARPYTPEQLRAKLAERATHHAGNDASRQQRGLFVSMLEMCFAPAEDAEAKRHAVQRLLFGEESATNISPDWILAGLDWLKPIRDEGGHYLPDAMAAREAQMALETAPTQPTH